MSLARLHKDAAQSFAAQGLMTHFGARIVEASDGRCVIEVPLGGKLTQQDGFFHGGVIASIADASCGHAAFTLAPEGSNVLSVEFKLNLLAPAKGERLRATGNVLRQGRTVGTYASRVEVFDGGKWVHCAEMLATMFTKPPKTGKSE